MTYLTREQILDADDRQYVDVAVPEWGGTVRVSSMSGLARDRYEMRLMSEDGKRRGMDNLRAAYCAAVCVDMDGNPVFTEADVVALGNKSAAALNRVFNAGNELNATSQEGMEAAAKN